MPRFQWATTTRPSPEILPFDVGVWPQVGAVAQCRDSVPREEDWLGSARWELDGSAVLIAPDHALTIRHVTTAGPGQDGRLELPGLAVFFPSVGLVPVEYGWLTRGEEKRDRLLLLKLSRNVPLPPIPAREVDLADVRSPQAVGFGDWEPPKDGALYPGGIQRRLTPKLLGTRYCFKDLCWDASLDGTFEAGTNNSGGALMERTLDGHRVVGIMRRVRQDIPRTNGADVVSCSAVSYKREGWLKRKVYRKIAPVPLPTEPPPVQWLELGEISAPVATGPIALPPGTAQVHATLSTARTWSGELYLQMHLLPDAPSPLPAEQLAAVGQDFDSAGEFLARLADVAGKASVTVAIAPASPLAGAVRAQVCLRFVDVEGRMLKNP